MNFSSTKEPLLPHLAPEPDVMMDINTTPLIDILLVLIIMLIITIPAQLHSVNLDMPVNPAQRTKEPNVIKISIDDKNSMSWNGSPIESQDELDARFSNIRLNNENVEIHIRSSARICFAEGLDIILVD